MEDDELQRIIEELRDLEGRFSKHADMGEPVLPAADRAKYKRLVLEAKSIIGSGLGAANEFALPLSAIADPPTFGCLQRPSVEDLHEAAALAEGGLNQLRRRRARVSGRSEGAVREPYVAPQRILQLRNIKGSRWDLARLVRMLEELNLASEQDAHVTTAMLVRAIADHVPPIFGQKSFSEVANNYAAGRSFSDQMKHLDTSMRKVADGLLHQQVRPKEALPTAQQVDFRSALDSLLAEVVRTLP